MQTALHISRLEKHFRTGRRVIKALDKVNLNAQSGGITGLIGPDGAGKTTLMRLVAGLLRPDAGQIQVLGVDAVQDPLTIQSKIGYMPQRFGLYEDLTVAENLSLYADLQGVPHAERPGRYAQLLRLTALEPFTKRLAGRLSGGMKQKLGLACTLVRPPPLLLLDEPTVGVDPVSRRELWQIINRLVAEEGMSVLLSTAYLDEAERCAQVVLLHQGQVLGQGAPHEFSQRFQGRVWYAEQAGVLRRRLQDELSRREEVLDTVLEGEGVRVLLADKASPPNLEGIRWSPMAPRFEDAFVAILAQQRRPALTSIENAPVSFKNETVIVARNVSRRFGDFWAVRHISFEVKKGEIFGLLGANGAGKSTTFRMLCGLLPPSEGQLTVNGVDLRKAPAKARAQIGYMAQRFSLYGHLGVTDNLRFFARTYGLKGARYKQRLDWALDEFDLRAAADAITDDQPLGYKQRLAMACALMHEPAILFLDEPTSGVDPLERRAFWARINALAEEGVTIMVTTHFMEEAEYCDRLAIMAQGRILAIDTPAAIRARAATQDNPRPKMEDAFVTLIQKMERAA